MIQMRDVLTMPGSFDCVKRVTMWGGPNNLGCDNLCTIVLVANIVRSLQCT